MFWQIEDVGATCDSALSLTSPLWSISKAPSKEIHKIIIYCHFHCHHPGPNNRNLFSELLKWPTNCSCSTSFQHSNQKIMKNHIIARPPHWLLCSEDALTISLAIFTLTSSSLPAILSEMGALAFLLFLEHVRHIPALAFSIPRMLCPQKLYDKLSSFLRRQALPPNNIHTLQNPLPHFIFYS